MIDPSERARELCAEWERVSARPAADRAHLLAGGRASSALQDLGRWSDAARIAHALLAVARATPLEALRDLAISLEHIGDAAQLEGELDRARGACEEGLSSARLLSVTLAEASGRDELVALRERRLLSLDP